MKRNLFYLILVSILFSCAAKKPNKRTGFLKGFYTQYNTLFNAEDALNSELTARSSSHKDNFYEPYISILTYGDDVEETTNPAPAFNTISNGVPDVPSPQNRRKGISGPPGMPQNNMGQQQKPTTSLEIAEAKALKAIEKYSVFKDGEEKNDKIFDAYIVLAKARIYMGKPLKAIDAVNQVSKRMKDDKRLPLADVFKGLAYAKLGDLDKANQIFASLKNEPKLKKDYQKLLSIYYAEALLAADKKEAAIEELENAFVVNSNREIKSRIAFLRGQILLEQGKNDLARESFVSAYQLANDFEFEVKSQIQIAKTYSGKSDYEEAKNYLEKISKKGTYGSRKNEFYYAIGLLAKKAGKREEAMDYFRKSLAEEISDPQIRGLDYYEIGKMNQEDNEYIAAGAYYDSALAVMTYEPTKISLQEQSDQIKKIAQNYYLIKKNDSILALSKMSKDELENYFGKFIAKLKSKEEALERERIKEEKRKGFGGGDYNANSVFAGNTNAFQDFGGGAKGFYFSNKNTISKGISAFKQIWGNRALADNWRYSATMSSIDDQKNAALGLSSAPNPRRYETSFYTEKIPKNPALLADLKKARDTAALGLGEMYYDYFLNRPLATTTLYDLVDNKPEEEVMLQALYKIFYINYQDFPTDAQRARQILLKDYPYTSYAEFARNPQKASFVNASPDAELAYRQAFALYENEKFEQSKAIIEQSLKAYPKDALVPKFTLLNAFNAGKTSGKEVMILQLEQIALNYKNTAEGEKAKEMLNYLKSDLQVQMTDDKGNKLQNKNNTVPKKGQPTPQKGVPQTGDFQNGGIGIPSAPPKKGKN